LVANPFYRRSSVKRVTFAFIAILVAVISGCSSEPKPDVEATVTAAQWDSSEGGPRTYYDSLDLGTPESAVQTLAHAFQREDFVTVYLVLAPNAQFRFEQELRLLNYANLFQSDKREQVFADVTVFSEGIGHGEHIDTGWYIFDQIMLAAKEHSALLIDLSGKVTIIDSEPSETILEEAAVDIITSVEGINGNVVFRMIQAPSGRWRVFQVIVPGGDEETWPWAIPRTKTIEIEAAAEIQVPCAENPPPPPEEVPGEPYVMADPTCGDLTTRDENNQETPGTTLTLSGWGFTPHTETEIWWTDPLGNDFRLRRAGEYVVVTTDENGEFQVAIVMPYLIIPPGAAEDLQFHQVRAVQVIAVDE
jgi:hypothetical protein